MNDEELQQKEDAEHADMIAQEDIEEARKEGYRQGIEDSANVVIDLGRDEQRTKDIVDTLRALLDTGKQLNEKGDS